jgi:hypothetical protein
MGAIDRPKRVAHDRGRGYAERGSCPRFLPFQFFDHTGYERQPDWLKYLALNAIAATATFISVFGLALLVPILIRGFAFLARRY